VRRYPSVVIDRKFNKITFFCLNPAFILEIVFMALISSSFFSSVNKLEVS